MILNTKKLSLLDEEKIANIDITKATVPVTINDNNIEGSTTGTPVTKKYVMSDAFNQSVLYTTQAKTSEQQSIARENIGAVSADDISSLIGLSARDFRGSINNSLIPNGTFQQATVTRVSGNISISSNVITLPKGTYHITIKNSATPHVVEYGSVYVDDASIVSAIYLDGTIYDQFDFHPDVTSSISQDFTYALDLVLSGTHAIAFYAKYVSTGTQQWDCGGDIWIHSVVNTTTGGESTIVIDSTLTGAGSEVIPLGINNPMFYVKGTSVYGGSLVTNLNTLTHNIDVTCFGTATGVPNPNYAWFVHHENSNTGTTAALQIAYAYNSASIICYERIKVNNTWGVWILRNPGVWPVVTFVGGTDISGIWESSTLSAMAGILYEGTAVTALTLSLTAQAGGEYHIRFATASSIGSFNLSAISHWIGTAPTITASKFYEMDVLDGVGICSEII